MAPRRAQASEEEWEEPEEEYTPLNIPPEFRQLDVEETKVTVRELWQRYLTGELVLEPDFQRGYVWDSARASRYIESLLLSLPTPAVFLSEEADGRWVIIDGHQRLETLFRYLGPLTAGPTMAAGKTGTPYMRLPPLRLSQLDVMPELNAKDITALHSDDRRQLWDTRLNAVILPRTAHEVASIGV